MRNLLPSLQLCEQALQGVHSPQFPSILTKSKEDNVKIEHYKLQNRRYVLKYKLFLQFSNFLCRQNNGNLKHRNRRDAGLIPAREAIVAFFATVPGCVYQMYKNSN